MDSINTPHARVSLDTIYELMLQTQNKVTEMNSLLERTSESKEDHERRIRFLERAVWVAAAIGALGGTGLQTVITAVGA